MSKILTLFILTLVALAAWRIGSALSSDAVSMAVGVLFGALPGIVSAILSRRPPPAPLPPGAKYLIQLTSNGWQVIDLRTNLPVSKDGLLLEVSR
jgi:hypothetical protein